MSTEAVKLARLNRQADHDRLLFDSLSKGVDSVVAVLSIDGMSLLATWLLVEWAQNSRAPWADPSLPSTDPRTHYIGPIAAASIQMALVAGFSLNGFAQSGVIGKVIGK